MLNYDDLLKTSEITSEIKSAVSTLKNLYPSIAIFGSGTMPETSKYYKMAYQFSCMAAKNNISIITGGGEGIMEAANKGANIANGNSIGLCIKLKDYEEKKNKFIHNHYYLKFHHFFTRKAIFLRYSMAVICFPGGLGTLDELMETLLMIRAKKISKIPVFLIGTKFWQGLNEWLQEQMKNYVPEEYLKMLKITDDLEEVLNNVKRFIEKRNFRLDYPYEEK